MSASPKFSIRFVSELLSFLQYRQQGYNCLGSVSKAPIQSTHYDD